MYLNLSPWLHGIKESVALFIETLMEVMIHPQPWRFLCLCGNLIKKIIIYDFHLLSLRLFIIMNP